MAMAGLSDEALLVSFSPIPAFATDRHQVWVRWGAYTKTSGGTAEERVVQEMRLSSREASPVERGADRGAFGGVACVPGDRPRGPVVSGRPDDPR